MKNNYKGQKMERAILPTFAPGCSKVACEG